MFTDGMFTIYFLSNFSYELQTVPPVSHELKCLINRIRGTFSIDSTYQCSSDT